MNLNQMINQWATDVVLLEAFSANNSEMSTDFAVVSHLLASCGSAYLDKIESQLKAALLQSYNESRKSLEVADKHILLAGDCNLEENYREAVAHYTEAIRYMPLDNEADYARLAAIFFRRMRSTRKFSKDIAVAVKDIELATMAHIETAELLSCEEDISMQQRMYKRRDSLIEPNEVDFVDLHPDLDVVTSVASGGNAKVEVLANRDIPAGCVVLSEMPFVKYTANPLKVCARCDLSLADNRFWPCQFCNEMAFCSRQCEQMHFSVHKYECGLFGYLKKVPHFVLMLRFYFRCNQTPVSGCSAKVDHINLYVNAVRNEEPVVGYALNAFRQSMDQHEQRHQLQSNRPKYFACLLQAIQFLHLYDECLFNADQLEANRITMANEGENPDQVAIGKREKFAWISAEWKASKAEAITCVFRDLKRFIACSLTKFTIGQNDQRDRELLVLTSALFPAVVGNRSVAAPDQASENVAPRFNDLMQMVASSDISSGEKLATRLYNAKLY